MNDTGHTRMLWRFLVACVLLPLCVAANATSSVDLDIGAPLKAGGTSFSSGIYTVWGGGAGIWNKSDQFHFNRGWLAGNGTVQAQVTSVSSDTPLAKVCVMLRNDVTPGSSFADVDISPGLGVTFEWRAKSGQKCAASSLPHVVAPVWLRLSRKKGRVAGTWTVVGCYSADGATWKQIGKPQDIALPETALAGIAVTASKADALNTSTLAHFSAASDLDPLYLHTQGNGVVNRAGKVVVLRGTNIGGWLVTEAWMCGDHSGSGRYALETLESRFGADQAKVLMNVWQDNWLTDRDMDNIQSYGINVVRVPFSWRNLQDADGNWYKDTSGNIDFSRFDWVVQEAAKRHIYVIFDYHIWPGEQKNYGDICEAGEPGLAQRAQSAAIWGALAQHFKGNGTVAAFDLINEPTGSNDFYAAHRAFYAAIRAQDPERMLVAEWVNTADFPKLGWTNIMCSGHYPASTKAKFDSFLAELPKHTDYSTTVPCYVGEWICDVGSNADQNAVDMTEALDRLGWCWTTWTYKTVNMGGWGLFDYTNSLRYNLATDPSDSILKQWQTELTQWQNPALPKNYYLNTSVIKALQQIGGGTE